MSETYEQRIARHRQVMDEHNKQMEEIYAEHRRNGTKIRFCAGTPEHSQSWNYTGDPGYQGCTCEQWVR
jgi:hypothetical protein